MAHMKAHVEIYIRLDLAGEKTLHDVLREFAAKTKGWTFPLESSLDYQKGNAAPAGFVISDSVKGLERGAVAIANLDHDHLNRFRVPNIVPRDSCHLTMNQYNAIGTSFAKNFRHFLRMNKYPGVVTMSGPEKKLSDIIRAEKCRKLFEAWLHTPTLISHPGDIQALHVFICELFKYGSDARSYEIGQFLIEDRGLKPKVANFVAAEIEKGLAILTVNRSFHRW